MSLEAIHTENDVDLREYAGVIWRRKRLILLLFGLALLAGFAFLKTTEPVYSAEARLVVEAQGEGVSMVDADNPLAELLSRTRPDSLSTQLQAMQISPFLNEAEKRVEAALPGVGGGANVRVENMEATDIIAVRATARDPRYAAEMANAVVDLHLERSQAQSLRGLHEALRFAEGEAKRTQQVLAEAESQLMSFRKLRRVEEVAIGEQERIRETLDLQTRVRQVKADLDSIKGEVWDLQARLKGEPEFLQQVVETDNPRLQQLRDSLSEVEQRHALELVNYKPTSPIVQQLSAQVADLQRRIKAEPAVRKTRTRVVNPQHLELAARLREREDELRRLRGQFHRVNAELQARNRQRPAGQLGAWEVRQAALVRDRDQAQKMHTLFLDKLQDLRIREKANRPGARVLLRATPSRRPSFPDPPRILLVACMMGLILGLAGAFLSERLDDRVHTSEEAERLAQSATLAHVPDIGLQAPRLVSALPAHSSISESYRILRSAIAFEALDEPIQTLLVTSVNRGEGKSLTSVNLASAIAMDGKRVLLVDADLRRPSVHALLHVGSQPGLSDFLSHRCSLSEVIRRAPDVGFDVIPSGPLPSNPSELLNTARMTELLHSLTGEYDVILIDSSPCTLVTDALVLAAKVSGVILVVDVGRTQKVALRHARELLDRARARVIGMVFNRAGRDGWPYYGRYGYYHGAASSPLAMQLAGIPASDVDPAGVGAASGMEPGKGTDGAGHPQREELR